jgi:hypothetical protein
MSSALGVRIPAANLCEECNTSPLFGVYENRKLCISCRKKSLENAISLVDTEETVDHNGSAQMDRKVYTPPIKNARSLVATLSVVMDGLLNKSINVETARAACNVSSETIKALDLIWRMDRGHK